MINNHSLAFTLVELLVTIAITSILASLSVAVFKNYKIAAYSAETDIYGHDARTATEAAMMDINNVKCTNQTQACSNAFNQFPRTNYKSITYTNVRKNFLLDYLSPKMINNPRIYYWITSDRAANSLSSYENIVRVRVLHCDGNRGYVFNGQFGRSAGIGIITPQAQTRTTKIGMNAWALNPCG